MKQLLPSGEVEVIHLERVGGEVLEVRLVHGDPVAGDPFSAFSQALVDGRIELSEPVETLQLHDVALVRDLAERRGITRAESFVGSCRNCDAAIEANPKGQPIETLLEARDDDLPAEVDALGELDPPIAGVKSIDMRPIDFIRARSLWTPSEPTLTPNVLNSMGVRALHDEGGTIPVAEWAARIESDPELAEAIRMIFDALNYPLRCSFPVLCPKCRTVHDVPTPSRREFDPDYEYDALRDDTHPFPDLTVFEARTFELAEEVFRERGVTELTLIVDDGVPPIDAGFEPLMGSYQASEEDGRWSFIITLYYVTFAKMYEEWPYDVDAEIRETIDHEVEHHLHHLTGYDPLDAEEQREARAELERTFGKQAVRDAERKHVARELVEMGRFFFWGLLLCLLLLAAAWALGLVN